MPELRSSATEVLSEVCYCGRTFSQRNALSNHRHYCHTNKKRLSSVLESARDAFTKRKKARITYDLQDPPNAPQPGLPTVRLPSPGAASPMIPAEADIPSLVSLTRIAQDAPMIQLAE